MGVKYQATVQTTGGYRPGNFRCYRRRLAPRFDTQQQWNDLGRLERVRYFFLQVEATDAAGG